MGKKAQVKQRRKLLSRNPGVHIMFRPHIISEGGTPTRDGNPGKPSRKWPVVPSYEPWTPPETETPHA